jgi:hypothetical protein
MAASRIVSAELTCPVNVAAPCSSRTTNTLRNAGCLSEICWKRILRDELICEVSGLRYVKAISCRGRTIRRAEPWFPRPPNWPPSPNARPVARLPPPRFPNCLPPPPCDCWGVPRWSPTNRPVLSSRPTKPPCVAVFVPPSWLPPTCCPPREPNVVVPPVIEPLKLEPIWLDGPRLPNRLCVCADTVLAQARQAVIRAADNSVLGKHRWHISSLHNERHARPVVGRRQLNQATLIIRIFGATVARKSGGVGVKSELFEPEAQAKEFSGIILRLRFRLLCGSPGLGESKPFERVWAAF